MINKAAYQDLLDAGMADAQAQVVASHIPDWSQFVTKQDLSQTGDRLIRWMVGIFLIFLALLGGLTALSLNIAGLLG